MLRYTFRFLRDLKGPSIVGRSVMAKAVRPVLSRTVDGSMSPAPHVDHHEIHVDPTPHALPSAAHETAPPPVHAHPQQQRDAMDSDYDKSEDAYRFLLHHIDSEISALKRRVQTVSKQRETMESSQTRRIRELFECIERPWLLLASVPAPQLPNKAFEVYLKEQFLRQSRNGSNPSGKLDEDPVFLDACRRNWRSLSIVQRKPYEVAGRRNENLRKELKKKMANGCTHFESFCDQAKEWTAEMVRGEPRSGPTAKKGPKPPSTRRAAPQTALAAAHANAMDTFDEEELGDEAEEKPSRKTARQKSTGRRNAKAMQTKSAGQNISASLASGASQAMSKKTVANRTHRAKIAQSTKKVTRRIVKKK